MIWIYYVILGRLFRFFSQSDSRGFTDKDIYMQKTHTLACTSLSATKANSLLYNLTLLVRPRSISKYSRLIDECGKPHNFMFSNAWRV